MTREVARVETLLIGVPIAIKGNVVVAPSRLAGQVITATSQFDPKVDADGEFSTIKFSKSTNMNDVTSAIERTGMKILNERLTTSIRRLLESSQDDVYNVSLDGVDYSVEITWKYDSVGDDDNGMPVLEGDPTGYSVDVVYDQNGDVVNDAALRNAVIRELREILPVY